MLESFKRFFSGPAPTPEWADVAEWAGKRALQFKRVHEGEGFVIDGRLDDKPWRMEWGPPQRAYIAGRELRIRMELKLPGDLQMLLLSKPLMDQLERQTYENFTEGLQTQIDTSSPEEMRWLVMFPKVNLSTLKNLRVRYGAVASTGEAGLAWLSGPLAHALEDAASGFLADEPPFVLMTLRGRAYLRMQMAEPAVDDVAAALAVFEIAVAQALLLTGESLSKAREWGNSSASTAWQSLHPDDSSEPPKRR